MDSQISSADGAVSACLRLAVHLAGFFFAAGHGAC